MRKVSIRIDERDVLAEEGATILEVALANKIYIPHLCYHPDLKPEGSCRLCLVEMEDGQILTSCRTPVKEGMVIKTKSPAIDKIRRPIVEVLIANHHIECKDCAKKGQCKLQRIKVYTRIDKERLKRLRPQKEELPIDSSNPFFERNPNKCVLCGICVQTCQSIQKVSAINFVGKGYTTKITTFMDKPIAQSRCNSCGECVVRCPTGALIPKNIQRPSYKVKTICPYCSVGCGIFLGIRDNTVVNVQGDKENPVNSGHLCVKGRFGLSFVNSPDRLTTPLIRIAPKGRSAFREASWDEALEFVASRLKNYKGEGFALIASTKCTNEDSYVAQKFVRAVMCSNNIDTSVRLCHATSVAALLQAAESWLRRPTGEKTSIEEASCILVVGSNITCSHPIFGLRIKKAVEKGAKLIVINPKEIDLCRFAKIWLKPYPGTDLALLMGICRVIVEEGLLDDSFIKESCDNFEDFKNSIDDFPAGRVERITRVSRGLIAEAARLYATSKPAITLWSSGLTQYPHGTNNVLALINLSILTGNVNGLIPLWGQNNSLGASAMGCLPDFYPAYQPVANDNVRKVFEALWGVSLNPKAGLTLTEIFPAIEEGKIKALYIIGSDPVRSITPAQKIRNALKKAEFIVLQDIFANETAEFADVILPASSFAEKDGVFTNTEGRVQRIKKAIEAVGNSRPDWQIICDLARRLGGRGFDFLSHEEIMSEILSVTSGFSTQIKRFRFTPLKYEPPSETPDIDHPLIMTTERSIYSGGFLARKVEGLNLLGDKRFIYINPKEATDFAIKDGDVVNVISRWGEIKIKAKITNASPPGVVTMDFDEKVINPLINPVLDAVAKTPATKACAVRIVSHQSSP